MVTNPDEPRDEGILIPAMSTICFHPTQRGRLGGRETFNILRGFDDQLIKLTIPLLLLYITEITAN